MIYIDPPYKTGLYEPVLRTIASSDILSEDGLAIIESLREEDLSFTEKLGFKITKEKLYKNNKHVFLVKE